MYKIVIFEGIDCSGKSTVIENLRKRIGSHKLHPWLIDRGPHSNYVYEKINGRDRLEELKPFLDKLNKDFDVMVMFLDVLPEVAYKRMNNKKDENFNYTIEDLWRISDYFIEAFKVMPVDLHIIEANCSIKKIVDNVYGRLYG